MATGRALRMSDVGRRLLMEQVIGRADFERALFAQATRGGTLGMHLVQAGVIDEDTLHRFLTTHYPAPAADARSLAEPASEALAAVPLAMARYFRLVPLAFADDAKGGRSLEVAMADPSDAHAMDEVGGFTGSPIVLRLARESEIEHALSRVYARPGGPLSPPPTPPGAPKDTRPPSGAASSIEEALSVEIEVDLVDEEESSSAAPSRPSQSGREPPAPPPSTSLDLPSALEQIRGASSRDAVIDLAVRAMAAFCRRAAFFIVRKGNVEGWQASGEGLVRSQIKKLWIPVTSASVFKDAMEGDGVTVAPLYDSTANRILAAAIGPRPAEVLLAVIRVQGRALGFLYGDTFTLSAAQTARIESLQAAVADAFERVLLGDKHK